MEDIYDSIIQYKNYTIKVTHFEDIKGIIQNYASEIYDKNNHRIQVTDIGWNFIITSKLEDCITKSKEFIDNLVNLSSQD